MVASSIPGMATALDNPHKITTVFVPATAFQDTQQLLFFGPFLVPKQDLGFWKKAFYGAIFGFLLAITGPILWLKLRNRTAPSKEGSA